MNFVKFIWCCSKREEEKGKNGVELLANSLEQTSINDIKPLYPRINDELVRIFGKPEYNDLIVPLVAMNYFMQPAFLAGPRYEKTEKDIQKINKMKEKCKAGMKREGLNLRKSKKSDELRITVEKKKSLLKTKKENILKRQTQTESINSDLLFEKSKGIKTKGKEGFLFSIAMLQEPEIGQQKMQSKVSEGSREADVSKEVKKPIREAEELDQNSEEELTSENKSKIEGEQSETEKKDTENSEPKDPEAEKKK